MKHYLALGVPAKNFLLVLNARSEWSPGMLRARKMLHDIGIEPQDIWIGEYESREKQSRVRKILDANVSSDDWVIHSDADEFHEFPQDIHDVIRFLEDSDYNAVQGPLIDRISKDGVLRSVDLDQAIWEQFSVECNIGGRLLGLAKREKGDFKNKILMYKGYLRANHGSGKISRDFEDKARYYKSEYKIHHFKWTDDVLHRLKRRVRTYKRIKYDWWIESQKFLDYYNKHGRIRIEDVS